MKKLLSQCILLILFLSACSSQDNEQGEKKKIEKEAEMEEESAELVDTIPESMSEENSTEKPPQEEIAVPFYNKLLSERYPNRKLKVRWNLEVLDYDQSLAEDIEGGGVSREYLRVEEYGSEHVGIIGFELVNGSVHTTCWSVLEPDNFFCTVRIIDVNGYSVLEVTSNRSGAKDQGPYDYTYYGFNQNQDRLTPLHTISDTEEFILEEKDRELIISALNESSSND